jgi:hypothetical protein
MGNLEFAAIVISLNVIVFCLVAVYASEKLDKWVCDKEEKYLYGNNE